MMIEEGTKKDIYAYPHREKESIYPTCGNGLGTKQRKHIVHANNSHGSIT